MRHKEKRVSIKNEIDIVEAVFESKTLAETAGFSLTAQCAVSTAVSELARNIFKYAVKGVIILRIIEKDGNIGMEVVAEDNGPGIENLNLVMKGNYSTGGSLGLGISGVKRLMDEFSIDTKKRQGLRIITRKWA